MTQSTSPHTAGRTESPRGIVTNGIGEVTTAHLNLTTNMRAQIRAEVDERLRHSTMKGRRTYRRRRSRISIQGDPRISA